MKHWHNDNFGDPPPDIYSFCVVYRLCRSIRLTMRSEHFNLFLLRCIWFVYLLAEIFTSFLKNTSFVEVDIWQFSVALLKLAFLRGTDNSSINVAVTSVCRRRCQTSSKTKTWTSFDLCYDVIITMCVKNIQTSKCPLLYFGVVFIQLQRGVGIPSQLHFSLSLVFKAWTFCKGVRNYHCL